MVSCLDFFKQCIGVEDIGDAKDGHRQVSTAGLLVIAFFWVCGGIYGNEALFQAGPPGIVFLMLLSMAFVFAIPVCLMVGELSTAFPYDGGMIAWVEETCGRRVGAHNTYWTFVSYILDSAIYPGFMAGYLSNCVDFKKLGGDYGVQVFSEIIVWSVTLIKLAGTDCLVRWSGLMCIVSIVPSVIFMLDGFKKIDSHATETWINMDTSEQAGGIDIPLLLGWSIWVYTGFFSLGSLAGEVKDPSRTYFVAIFVLVPAVIVFSVWPLAVSLAIDSDRLNYEAGYFSTLATDLAGSWLGYFFQAGACASFLGLFAAQTVVCERSLAACVQPVPHDQEDEEPAPLYTGANPVLRYLLIENGTGIAPVYILFNAVILSALVWLKPEELVECSILQGTPTMLLTCYAYLFYKEHSKKERPFTVPGGRIGGYVCMVPIVGFLMVNMYYGVVDSESILGIPYAKAIFFGACTGLGFLVHGAMLLGQRLCCSRPPQDLEATKIAMGPNDKETPDDDEALLSIVTYR